MTKIGTLAEIGAEPGDTVMLVENGIIAGKDVGKLGVVIEGDDGDLYTRGDDMHRGDNMGHKFRIVSRASYKPEPKVETVTLYGSPSKHIQWCLEQCALDTHRITFSLIDGEPDCTSIKMEKLQ